jgi:ABC-type Fe3+/spermidine/putrescine transport system ATPase subunit
VTEHPASAPGLQVDGLSIGHHGVPVARDVALTVSPGEILAVLGPSGSGKSTLLATIAGIIPALAGRIVVDGRDVTDVPVHARHVGMIFQEPLLFPHLSVLDNIGYGLRRQGLSRPQARERAVELLDWIRLPGYGQRPVAELSGGQAQRVALARAIAPHPAVLLLDEPFSALDQDLRRSLSGEVRDIVQRERIAAVHVTHDPAEAQSIADRAATLAELST